MAESEVIRILLEFEDIFNQSNFIWWGLRLIGWGIIKAIAFLVDSIQNGLDKVIDLINFFDSSVVNSIVTLLKPIAIVFLAISILYIGYNLMINKKKFDRSKVPLNFLVSLMIIFLLPTVMTQLASLSKSGLNLFISNGSTIAEEIVSNNVKDLYLYDSDNFSNRELSPSNYIPKKNILKISPVEEIDRGEVNNKKIFQNEVRPVIDNLENDGGGFELKRINGWFKIDSEYYRYDINFFTIMATLLISAVVLIFTIIKLMKLCIELAFSKVFIMTGAFADIGSGQRTKQIIMHILGIYITIVSIGLTLNLYILATAYISNNVGGIFGVICNLGAGLFVLDGPNLLEKVFGVDAGLSSGVRTIMGLNSALELMSKAGAGLHGAYNIGKSALTNGAMLGAGMKGFKDGTLSSLDDDMKDEGYNPILRSTELPNNDNGLIGDGSEPNNPNEPNSPKDGNTFDEEVNSSSMPVEDSLNGINSLEDDTNIESTEQFKSVGDDASIESTEEFKPLEQEMGDNSSYNDNGFGGFDSKNNRINSEGDLNNEQNTGSKFGTSIDNLSTNPNNHGEWDDFNDNIDNKAFSGRSFYDKPDYINKNETRNVKDLLSASFNKRVNNLKNSELKNKMKFGYTIGNNTRKDLDRFVTIKKEEAKDKIVMNKIMKEL